MLYVGRVRDYNDRWCVENNRTHHTLVMYYNIFVHTIRLIIIVAAAAVGKDNAREEKSKSDATKPRFLYMPMKSNLVCIEPWERWYWSRY